MITEEPKAKAANRQIILGQHRSRMIKVEVSRVNLATVTWFAMSLHLQHVAKVDHLDYRA